MSAAFESIKQGLGEAIAHATSGSAELCFETIAQYH
jgi:hypothetical protein